jgi:hypothetical protein
MYARFDLLLAAADHEHHHQPTLIVEHALVGVQG